MKRSFLVTLILLGALLVPFTASAATIRAYIADFAVSPADSGDLKTTLKRLFASRLSGDGIVTVDTQAEADVVVTGSYTMLGKMFSLDAFAKSASGKQLASAYEQGEGLDALIPAVGKISSKLRAEIVQQYQQAPAVPAAPATPQVKAPAGSEIVRSEVTPGWTSQRLTGVMSGIASWGGKEVVIADEAGIHLYRQGAKLSLVTEAAIPERMKILGVDALDFNGNAYVFVTIIDREFPASRVYQVQNDTLKVVAQDLPYMFRVVAPYGGAKQLYVQQMGRTDDYYGDVYEATFADGKVKTGNALKMPRFANIFNFNLFRDQSGKSYLTAFNESGYLLVYSDNSEEIWRSNEKLGGSETYYQRRDLENERVTGSPFRTRFIDQRITVTDKGEVIVPQNGGFFVLGNVRSYSKYSMVSFTWNGSTLEEAWRTKTNQNYLSDYVFNPVSREFVLLEVAQKPVFGGKGGSMVRVLKAE